MRAGDLFAWAVQTCLDAGVSLFYILTGVVHNAPVRITTPTVVVDANGLAAFSIPGSTTGAWAPATYQWVLFSLDTAGNRAELAQGKIRVQPDPAAQLPADPRSRSERILANIRCVLQGRSLSDAQMYKIGTRELTKMPIKELLFQEGVYEERVRKERIRRGENVPSRTVGITFGPGGRR